MEPDDGVDRLLMWILEGDNSKKFSPPSVAMAKAWRELYHNAWQQGRDRG